NCRVVIWLLDGTRIVDTGEQISLVGHWTSAALHEMSEGCARHGWTEVNLSGSAEFKEEMSLALMLRVPPIKVRNCELSQRATAKLNEALERRRLEEVSNAISGAREMTARRS